MKILIYILFIIGIKTQAAVVTNLEVTQNQLGLHFKVTIEGSDKTILQLTPLAKITQFGNMKLTKNEKGFHLIKLLGPLKAHMQYQIAINPKTTYFLSGLEVWHPVDPQFLNDGKFKVVSHLADGFELIHSAIGYNQNNLAYVFGSFKKYVGQDKRLQIFLTKEDQALADTLLVHLKKYLDHYENSIGAYPYDVFSVVESASEIGYAFPKMTWMGSQLLRFPFILKTSLPHELLHSWWGTGVFVDYEKGNWCEGLTAFGADYGLLNTDEKKLYRVKALTSYLNYVKQSQELSLSLFTSRGEDRSLQALGYDKAVMVFVMLEQLIGEQSFSDGLKKFYTQFKFKKASWDDLFSMMSEVSQKDLTSFKNYWVQKPGFITQDFLKMKKTSKGIDVFATSLDLKKMPSFKVQSLIHKKTESQNLDLAVSSSGDKLVQNRFSIVDAQSYSLDPDFYLFRDLGPREKPLNFSEFIGAKEITLKVKDADWVAALKAVFPDKKWVNGQSSVVVIGLQEAWLDSKVRLSLQQKSITLNGNAVQIEGQSFDLGSQAIFISLRVQNQSVLILNLNPQLPASRWLQRWSRYGSQSYVVLNNASVNLQGVWLDLFKVEL